MFPKNYDIEKVPSLANCRLMLKMEAHILIWYFRGFVNSYNYKKDSFKAFLEETKLKNQINFMYYKAHTQIQELKG